MNYADIYSRRPIVTDFRALCTELVEAWDSYSYVDAGDAVDRMDEAVKAARAALAAAPEATAEESSVPAPAVPALPPGYEAIGPEWQPCVKLPITVHVRQQRPGETHVSTREGITPVQPDDLIMRGVQGEEYPIGRELFNQTYRLGVAEPAPPAEGESPAESLAARPLLEKVARLGDVIGHQTVAQVQQVAKQAAAWLQENPPGQPVAIEPRGCPMPGACSCVEPAAAMEGEVAELVAALRGSDELLSIDDLREAWDAQSDAFNSWDQLGVDEIAWWAQRQALARWGRYPAPPAEGEDYQERPTARSVAMTDLSPAAQAVLDAFNREARPEPHHQREAIAAALRAAADQVEQKLRGFSHKACQVIRSIATELEGHHG